MLFGLRRTQHSSQNIRIVCVQYSTVWYQFMYWCVCIVVCNAHTINIFYFLHSIDVLKYNRSTIFATKFRIRYSFVLFFSLGNNNDAIETFWFQTNVSDVGRIWIAFCFSSSKLSQTETTRFNRKIVVFKR